jgi:polysaccharide export outer membrane protein
MRTHRNTFAFLTAFAAFLSTINAVYAEYRLGPGDVMEVSVFGVADLKRRVTVNVDGDVSMPFLGEVRAEGLTLDALRLNLAQALLRSGTLQTPDVTLEITEYRPFFISGDVAKPGAIAYRPGLTVRHAVALAGGFDALRFKADNPLLSAPEFRSQYEAAWTELVRRQARVLSLQAQLDGKTAFDRSTLVSAPISRSVIDTIADLEQDDLGLRIAAYERERTFLAHALERDRNDVSELTAAAQQQKAVISQQLEASARTLDAQSRGVVAVMRVDEDRRSLAGLRSQNVDTSTRLVQAEKDRDDIARRIDAQADENRSKLGRDLQDAIVESEKIRSQIRGTGEKLVYVGALKAQLRSAEGGPKIFLHRKVDGRPTEIPANEATEVRPDDVVDVVIRPDQLVVTPQK